ncbi:hypothetical protein AV540_11605 [Brevibacillus parabrevis]|nr:hypothetical protein AV540_11605 [Brevibacillus parabrevis]
MISRLVVADDANARRHICLIPFAQHRYVQRIAPGKNFAAVFVVIHHIIANRNQFHHVSLYEIMSMSYNII